MNSKSALLMNCFVTCVVSSFIFPCYEVQNNFVRYSSSIGQIAKDGGLFWGFITLRWVIHVLQQS